MNPISRLTHLVPLGLMVCLLPASATTPVPSANPLNEEMVLVFADEFDGDRLNDAVWTSQAYNKDLKRDTARGPGNLEVRDGELRLHVRRERMPVGNRVSQWTAGYVYTRDTVEPNTFVEARFKAGQASGVNNAFWLACVEPETTGVRNRYEIDIVETRQDVRAAGAVGKAHLAWHDWKTAAYVRNAKGARDHIAQGAQVTHSFDEYHTWGLWLGEREFIYYLNGQEVWRGDTHPRLREQWRTGVGKFDRWFPQEEERAYGRFGQDDWHYYGGYTGDRMNVVFSNLPWPESWTPLTDAADGTHMAIDYVRLYRPRRLVDPNPVQHELVEAVRIAAGGTHEVPLATPVALGAAQARQDYFSFVTESGRDAKLRFEFVDERGQPLFFVGCEDGNLVTGIDAKVTSATAFPARERGSPRLMEPGERIWIVRYTPPLEEGGRATVSVSVFPLGNEPAREPFFHANVDLRGNTSMNNEWHLNARDHTPAVATVYGLRGHNSGASSVALRSLKTGLGYLGVRGSAD